MSENRMVTVPSAAATRAISLRSSIAHVAKSSIELSSMLAHALLPHLGGGLDDGLHRRSGGLQGATAAARRTLLRGSSASLELDHLGLCLGELLGEHSDRGDRGSQQHPEEDRDHGEGGHATTIPQARARTRAAVGSMR